MNKYMNFVSLFQNSKFNRGLINYLPVFVNFLFPTSPLSKSSLRNTWLLNSSTRHRIINKKKKTKKHTHTIHVKCAYSLKCIFSIGSCFFGLTVADTGLGEAGGVGREGTGQMFMLWSQARLVRSLQSSTSSTGGVRLSAQSLTDMVAARVVIFKWGNFR